MKQPNDTRTMELPLVQLELSHAEADLLSALLFDRFHERKRVSLHDSDGQARYEAAKDAHAAFRILEKLGRA